MSLLDEIQRDLKEAEKDWGDRTFKFGGVWYPCTHNTTIERQVEIEVGGNLVAIQAGIVIRVGALNGATAPASGDTIQLDDGRKLKVHTADDIHGNAIRLALMDPER